MVDFNKIKDYWCFVTDNDGHWYRIPVNTKFQFEKWVEVIETIDFTYDDQDFSKYRSMHPINYMFKDVEVLKENI